MKEHAIVLHSVVPVRSEQSEQSEQITQMLFGEICTILDEKPRWNRVKLEVDGQEGWVDTKTIAPMSEEEYTTYTQALDTAAMVVFPMTFAVSENNGQTIPLTAGTRLTNYQDGRFEVLGVGFCIDAGMVAEQAVALTQETLQQRVRFFLNVPYLWGGKNALGMDCSGFTQVVMSFFGRTLLRNASEQATQGVEVPDLAVAQAGDLAFFCHEDAEESQDACARISHVGILLDSERIMHCSGRVKVEKVDKRGIVSSDVVQDAGATKVYTHRLVAIRRMR